MLDKINLDKTIDKKEYKAMMEQLQPNLSFLQRECKRLGIPVMIVFEGLSASGKGTLINQLIEPLDPRGFKVYSTAVETEDEKRHPFLWRFWTKTPENGRIVIFDRSWYRRVLVDRFSKETSPRQLGQAFGEIRSFEKQLTDSGMLIIKLFICISKKEQSKRMEQLQKSKKTAWRVGKADKQRNEQYEKYLAMNEEMLEKTDSEHSPWHIIEGTDRKYAAAKVMSIVAEQMETAIREKEKTKKSTKKAVKTEPLKTSVLAGVNLDKSLTKEEYKEKRNKLQKRLSELHNEIYKYKIPVVLAFEGWDAGGKGGAIKRLTQALDPRGYVVNPVASPNDIEKAHHYLWRFWNNFPKSGHIAIFDRSWYGRVMVERIEGFCTTEEWQRAYKEMNQMEEQLYHSGAVILKFWMHIDEEEQLRRFTERQETPEKQWKITDEDWRNREKWDLYEEAVDEMLIRTSTTYAPWIIVEANSKYYARIKVLETVVHALEKAVQQEMKNKNK